jgi:hypothetical protein
MPASLSLSNAESHYELNQSSIEQHATLLLIAASKHSNHNMLSNTEENTKTKTDLFGKYNKRAINHNHDLTS